MGASTLPRPSVRIPFYDTNTYIRRRDVVESVPIIEQEVCPHCGSPALVGHAPDCPNRENGEEERRFVFMTDPEQRYLLAERVDELIHRVDVSNHRELPYPREHFRAEEQEPITHMVFLDRSARPIATLFLDLWKKKHPDIPRPEISFFNIGTEVVDRIRACITGVDSPDEQLDYDLYHLTYNQLKRVFGEAEVERIRSQYRFLNETPEGSHVQIVDEYGVSGRSVLAAWKILQLLFPHLHINYQGYYIAPRHGELFKKISPNGLEEYDAPWRTHSREHPTVHVTGVVDSDAPLLHPAGRISEEALAQRVTGPLTTESAHLYQTVDDSRQVLQLRREMHAIADEYWESKQATSRHVQA